MRDFDAPFFGERGAAQCSAVQEGNWCNIDNSCDAGWTRGEGGQRGEEEQKPSRLFSSEGQVITEAIDS